MNLRRNQLPMLAVGRLLVIVSLALAGCGDDGSGPPAGADDVGGDVPVVGNQDDVGDSGGGVDAGPTVEPGPLSFDESGVTATLMDGELAVHLAFERAGAQDVDSEASAELLTLDGTVLSTGSVLSSGTVLSSDNGAFAFDGVDGLAMVALPLDEGLPAGAEEAGYLLHYSLMVGEDARSGWKSLLTALPKIDVRARVPRRLLVNVPATVRVFALDPWTGAPLEDVPVSLRMTTADGGEEEVYGTTGEAGTTVLELPGGDEGEAQVEASASEGDYAAGYTVADVEVQRSHRVLLTTDKPRYQPGQTMYVRALSLTRPSLAADAGSELTFEVYDGKGNMVFREYAETDDFGVASTTFRIANQVNEGDYRVKALIGSTETARTVVVEHYVLPKFGVAIGTDKGFYLPGETAHVTVDAQYFFGKAVAGALVELEAATFDIGWTAFANAAGTTNDAGLFQADIALPDSFVGQPLESGNAIVALNVTVTDGAGHAQEVSRSFVVAPAVMDVVAIPESGGLVPGIENAVYLFVLDPLGQPVDATLAATLAGADLDVEVLGTGTGRVFVTPDGPLTLETAATTAAGEAVLETHELGVDDEAAAGLLLRTGSSLYTVGDTLDVQVLTASEGGRVFLDVIKDGQTQLTMGLDVVDGIAAHALDLDPGLVGDLMLEAYRVGSDASIVRDRKLVFVADATGLTITVTPGQDVYAPGEDATIDFDVTDAAGDPVVAALGVQIVDEAVYAISEMKPGLLETYFLIQEELQQPRYEIHGFEPELASVCGGAPEDDAAQVAAAGAFAALALDEAAGELSSWASVRDALPGVLAPSYKAHMDEIEAEFDALEADGTLTAVNALELIGAGDLGFFDYWGHPYELDGYEEWDGFRATVTSRGPDEVAGTWDDWTGTVEVLVYDWRWDAVDEDGGPPMAGGGDGGEPGGGAEGPRVRTDFPETLYFNPALITGSDGHAEVALTMADSITEWRITTLGHTKTGALGSTLGGVTVFQDFFVDVAFPASLTRNDEVTFPVALYNYLPAAQTVEITLTEAPWFELAGSNTALVELEPGEVTSVSFPVKVTEVGLHALTVTGIGTSMSDAVQRVVRVVPDGLEERQTASGMLEGAAHHEVSFPADLIPNSHELLLKVYPGIMAQAVEGLDSMLQMPSGCFEQTTATNWPNTLVLDYLRGSGQVSPDIELKALDYLHQGYQRLLTFECTGGGFVWFGDPSPANVVLSAMGVLEFSDMARVIEVDDAVIARTADWLVDAQAADGHWHTDQGSEFATVQYDDVKTTAFSAWALAESPHGADSVTAALAWLTPHAVDPTTDVYALAMMGNAFATGQPAGSATSALLDRLADLAHDEDGKVWWEYEGSSYNYGGGSVSGVNGTSIEVTSLAVMAFIAAGDHLDLVGPAIAWLAGNKDSLGNWGTTHATILSLRAMVRSLQNKTEEGEGTVTVKVDRQAVETLEISDENRNVFHQIDLRELVNPGVPALVDVLWEGTGNLMYQLVWSWWTPGVGVPPVSSDILSIDVAYDTTELSVSDLATCTVAVTNDSDATATMVMVDVGLPPGFRVVTDWLDAAVQEQQLMKYELPGQQVSLYVESLPAGETLTLQYQLQAEYPVKAMTAPSAAYLYYDTEERAETAPVEFIVQ